MQENNPDGDYSVEKGDDGRKASGWEESQAGRRRVTANGRNNARTGLAGGLGKTGKIEEGE